MSIETLNARIEANVEMLAVLNVLSEVQDKYIALLKQEVADEMDIAIVEAEIDFWQARLDALKK